MISGVILFSLATLLILPSATFAKQPENNIKNMTNKKVDIYQNYSMNAKWYRLFDEQFLFEGNNGQGKIKTTDQKIMDQTKKNIQPVFRYVLADHTKNGHLSNGDNVLIHVLNRGGNTVKSFYYTIGSLDGVKDPEPVQLKKTSEDLDSTYGAVRFLNFNNLGTGAEVYLTDSQEKLGTENRTQIDFYRGLTTDGQNPIGDWEDRNKLRFGYDSEQGKILVELNAEYVYRAEYSTQKNADFNAIQFMLLNRESNSVVKLENIEINGKKISDTILVGNSTWPKWNLEGNIQTDDGDFLVEADLVISGDQPKNETNKVEILFGKK